MSTDAGWQSCTDGAAEHVLRHCYGMDVTGLLLLIRKSVNAVWRVETRVGTFVLKRLGRPADPDWLRFQHAAITRAADHGVPVQTLLAALAGSTTVDYDGTQWQLRQFASGRLYADGSSADLDQAAACLDLLHRVPLDDLPTSGSNPIQDMEHWLGTDESGLDDLAKVVADCTSLELWSAVYPAYRAAYLRARSELDSALYGALPQGMSHGEFAGSNIVFGDDGTVSCVLDWDGVDLRPRAYDLARAALFLARTERGSFVVHPDLAANLLVRATVHRPIEARELAAIIPILELYCVPTPRYVAQLAEHTPHTIEWFLNWAAAGAGTVRASMAQPIARITDLLTTRVRSAS